MLTHLKNGGGNVKMIFNVLDYGALADGISPDNCKNVKIYNCDVESGDDGIVVKSSYTLNRLDECRNIKVWDCRVKSRCSAIKFGTETN